MYGAQGIVPLVCECFELGLSDLPLKSGHPGVTADSQVVMSPQVHQGHLQPLLSVEMVVNPHCHRRYGRDYDCPTGDGMNVAVCPSGIRTEVSACQQKGCNSSSYRGFYKRSHVSK